jgi:4-hydroxy-4-methyl-2-oxoglutarate aldolase
MHSYPQLAQQLYSAVLSDVLDSLGYMHQAVRPFMRPVDDALAFMGPARTGLYMTTYQVTEGENPYELEMRLIDDLKPGEVAVLACGGPTERIAPWGELLTTAARARGAAGCVTDGLVRDVRHIRAMRFPVYHGGIGPLDTRGRARMMEMDTPVVCGGVRVRSGDIVFGDVDGVVVIPHEIADQAIALAQDKVTRENHTRDELAQGQLLREVYAKYKVL